jgi:L-iditol 2-dehydrogenase
MSPGCFSEFILLRERVVSQAARVIPKNVPDESAAFLEPAACVLRGIDKAEIQDTQGCAVVIGGGSMGLLHLVVLRAVHPDLGIIVTDPIDERRALARTLGATMSCRPEQLGTTVNELTNSLGADAVFDTVGGSQILISALAALRPGGTVVLFAHAAERETAGFELNPLFKNEQRVVASYSGSLDEQDRVADLLFSGRLDPRPLITHRIPLDNVQDAVDLARQQQALKILIGPPSNGAQ